MSIIGSLKEILSRAEGPNVEIEVKLGFYNDTFRSYLVNYRNYDRVLKYITESEENYEFSTFEDRKWKAYRHRLCKSSNEFVEKRRLHNFDIPEYNLRTSISVEDPNVVGVEQILKQEPDVIRFVQRYSKIYNQNARIDLSRVEHISGGGTDIRYELEIEHIGKLSIESLKNLNEAVINIFKITYATHEIYKMSEVRELNQIVNSLLSGGKSKSTERIAKKYFNQARNLHDNDIVHGGIINNPETSYHVTDKADGERKLLGISSVGIWLFWSGDYNLVHRKDFKKNPLVYRILLEGEYLPESSKKKNPSGEPVDARMINSHTFLTYDILSNPSKGIDVQKENHVERMKMAAGIVDLVKKDGLFVGLKQFKGFTKYDFFGEMGRSIANLDLVPYITDGLMFIPVDKPYNVWYDTRDDIHMPFLNKRVLTNYPDICKWKPSVDLTIDLQVSIDDGDISLLTIWTEGKKTVHPEFVGTYFNPANMEQLFDPEDPIINPEGNLVKSGTIVEFVYDPNWKTHGFQLIGRRIRHDKTGPNAKDVVEDTWDLAHRPLSIDTMRGKGTALMRRQHNGYKKTLWNNIPRKSKVLDIGIGAGGDLDKQKHLNKVFGVDVSEENIQELHERLKVMKTRNNHMPEYKILKAGGEDVESIAELLGDEKVDAVTLMLSMTFFWKDSYTLQRLATVIRNSLKPGGKIYFLTLDGDSLQEAFSPALGGIPIKEIKSDDIIMKRVGENGIYIDIADSIVRKQTEYMVYLNDLALMLGAEVTKQRAPYDESGSYLMNATEKVYTALMSYGVIDELDKYPIKNPPIEIKEHMTTPHAENIDGGCAGGTCNVGPGSIGGCALPAEGMGFTKTPYPARRPTQIYMPSLAGVEFARLDYEYKHPMYRLNTVADGSCYFHAVLGAVSRYYQNLDFNASGKYVRGLGYQTKIGILGALRRDLSLWILSGYEDVKYPGYSNYFVFNEASMPIRYLTHIAQLQNAAYDRISDPNSQIEKAADGYIDDSRNPEFPPIDPSESGFTALLNSSNPVGQEAYSLLSDFLGIDIYLGSVYTSGFTPTETTAREGRIRKGVIIAATGNGTISTHYETVCQIVGGNGKYLKFIFEYDDPLLNGWTKATPPKIDDVIVDDGYGDDPLVRAVKTFEKNAEEIFASIENSYLIFINNLAAKNANVNIGRLDVFRYYRHSFGNSFDVVLTSVFREKGVSTEDWPDQVPLETPDLPLGLRSSAEIKVSLNHHTGNSSPPKSPNFIDSSPFIAKTPFSAQSARTISSLSTRTPSSSPVYIATIPSPRTASPTYNVAIPLPTSFTIPSPRTASQGLPVNPATVSSPRTTSPVFFKVPSPSTSPAYREDLGEVVIPGTPPRN